MSLPHSRTPEPSFSTVSSSQVSSSTHATTPAKESQNGVKKRTRKRASILTDEQKKKHHIESEHKRRHAIREAFEKLVDIVPELTTNDSRSEIVVLNKSSAYLRQLHREYKSLMSLAKEHGFSLDDELLVELPNGLSGG